MVSCANVFKCTSHFFFYKVQCDWLALCFPEETIRLLVVTVQDEAPCTWFRGCCVFDVVVDFVLLIQSHFVIQVVLRPRLASSQHWSSCLILSSIEGIGLSHQCQLCCAFWGTMSQGRSIIRSTLLVQSYIENFYLFPSPWFKRGRKK